MDPFCTIEDFFSALSLSDYRKYIISMLRAAGSERCWQKRDPGSLLYFQQKMVDLIRAAHILGKIGNGRYRNSRKAIIAAELLDLETIDPSAYLIRKAGNSQWLLFPRYLSGKEFLNPYRAFRGFFAKKSIKKWEKDLKEIVFYALSPHNSTDDLMDFDFLGINQSLQKLVEAAHLIWVREIHAVTGEK
jgi:hypothetical protein